eukprot:gene31700-32350_t
MIGDPKAIGLDVLLPIYFLGLVMGFRKRDRFLPIVAVSAVASVAGMHFVGSPWHVSIGALAGVLLAACLPPVESVAAPPHLNLIYLIIAAAVATFVTRIGGYVLITQMKQIPPRLEAALNAVPAAVLTTLVAPAFVYGGFDVAVSMFVAF